MSRQHAKLIRNRRHPRGRGDVLVHAGHALVPTLLWAKLLEELAEVRTACRDPAQTPEITEELADTVQVLIDLAELHEVEWKDVMITVQEKRDKHGNFTEPSIILEPGP